MAAGCDPLGRSSGGALKISGVPFATAVKGLYQLDGVWGEGSSEPEKSWSKSLVTVLGNGSGVCADDGENVSSAARRDALKSSFMGGSMAASLAAALRNGFVTTGCGERKSPSSPDGDVNGSAKDLGGGSKGFELLTPLSFNGTALLEEFSAPTEASLKRSGEFRDTLGGSAVVFWVAVSR